MMMAMESAGMALAWAGTSTTGKSPKAAGGGAMPREELADTSFENAAMIEGVFSSGIAAKAAPCTRTTKSCVEAPGQDAPFDACSVTQGLARDLIGLSSKPEPRAP